MNSSLTTRRISTAWSIGLALTIAVSAPSAAADDPCAPHWDKTIGEPGVDTWVRSLAVFDDGAGAALFAGGSFTTAGDAPASRIAKWDGSQWSALGEGLSGAPSTTVRALAPLAGTVTRSPLPPGLYVGGAFTTAGGTTASNVARWDGSQWWPLGDGVSHTVSALLVVDDDDVPPELGPALYVGGLFTHAGGEVVNNIAKWDGEKWTALCEGTAGNNPSVRAMAVFDDGSGPALYVGGNFTSAGGQTVNSIARWDGSEWTPLGEGLDCCVRSLAVFDDGTGPALYAGGSFIMAGDVLVRRIAKWDGSEWSALGSGMSGVTVIALDGFDDGTGPALYAGGVFFDVSGVWSPFIAKWNGSKWLPVDGGPGTVHDFARFDEDTAPPDLTDRLYVSGFFTGGVTTLVFPQTAGPADLNCDGVVDVLDLQILVGSFGPCPDPHDCPADLNGDGVVNHHDLLLLLSEMSPGKPGGPPGHGVPN